MPQVRILTSIAGGPEPRYELGEHAFTAGAVVDLTPAHASAWIGAGLAEAVETPKKKGKN